MKRSNTDTAENVSVSGRLAVGVGVGVNGGCKPGYNIDGSMKKSIP